MRKHGKLFPASQVAKLDDPERLTWLPPAEVIGHLGLAPGMAVADVGAGTGYFAIPFAKAVAPGRVAALDVQKEMIAHLARRVATAGDVPIDIRHAEATATGLPPGSQDVVFLANVWHELDEPRAALTEAKRVLREGGRLAVLDWRPDVARPPGPPLDERVAPTAVAAVLDEAGWRVDDWWNVGPYSYLLVARPSREP